MTKRLEQARSHPSETQDETTLVLTPEDEADLLEARSEMERGEFADAAAVEAVFAKYRG